MYNEHFRKMNIIRITSVIILISFHAAVAGQNPSFTTYDSTKRKSEKVDTKKNDIEEKQRQERERRKQAGEIENDIPPGVIPSVTAIQEFPAGTPAFIRDSLDNYIKRGMELWQIPGLSIAIVKDGKVILSKGYGVTEKDRSSKVDENTLFIIASNTKLFTGTALAKLDHEKKLSLNDRVTKYFPWFKLYDSASTRLANIRDMLCHRIGLKTFQGDFTFWDSNLAKDSIIWKMRYLKPSGEFRQDYGYCNSAFLVAGRVLEKVTGGNLGKIY
jgi:CubicO group peptidase (beta-lactamase class C family)